MRRRIRGPVRCFLHLRRASLGLLLPLLIAGCGGPQSMLGSSSPGAAAVERFWWFSLSSTGMLALLAVGALLYAVTRSGRASAPLSGGDTARREERFILLVGAVFPALFLVVFLVQSVRTGASAAPPPGPPGLTIEVVGHMFWWDVRYPDHGITTANEIHIPEGVPVAVVVRSADVIHSFWVPQLSPGKVDMVPGRSNTTWLLAPEPGIYRGQCTEFCGVQHALMSLEVVAHSAADFEEWVARRSEPPPEPAGAAALGREVFLREGCAPCHAVQGVSDPGPAGDPGPDLTHLASRRTLGALVVPNTPENLRAWVEDPHHFKPGVRMPGTRLPPAELDALVAYLTTLH